MLEEPEKLVEGMKIMLRLFDNARGILAVEDNKPDCIELLKKITKDETRIIVKAPWIIGLPIPPASIPPLHIPRRSL